MGRDILYSLCNIFIFFLLSIISFQLLSFFFLSSVFLHCTVKKEEETFIAHLSGILPHDQLRLSLSGDLVNSIRDLAALPNSASLVGVLTLSKGLTEGKSKINVPMHLL